MHYLYVFCIICLISFGQTCHVYSKSVTAKDLKEALRTEKEDSARMKLYLQLSTYYKEHVNLLVRYADSAILIAQRHQDSAFLIKSYSSVARDFIILADFNSALTYANLALEKFPSRLRNTEEEADVYVILGDIKNRLNNYKQAIDYYSLAYKIGSDLSNDELLARIDNNMGVAYWHTGNLNMALDSYMKALSIFEHKKDTISSCMTYSNIASIYDDLGHPVEQLEYLKKAYDLADLSNNLKVKSWSFKEMGAYYLGEYDTLNAMKYYEKLYDIADKTTDTRQMSEIYIELAQFYNKIGEKDTSFRLYQKALTINAPPDNTIQAISVHKALSELYQAESLSDSALFHGERAFTIAFESGDKQTLALVSQMLARHYQQKGNINKSIDYAIMAYDNSLGRNPVMARDVANLLGILYESAGKHEESNFYMKTYYTLADSIRNSDNYRNQRLWSSQIEFEKKETELNSKIQYQQQKLKMQRTLGIMLVCVLVMAISLAIISYRNDVIRKQTNNQLASQKEELMQVNEQLIHTNKELDHYKGHLEELVEEKIAELQAALKKAQESDRFKAAFFANMSHEIRTPLNAILGFLQLIDEPSLATDKRDEMIEHIHVNANQLLSMVSDIVTLSKIDSGLLEVRPQPVNTDHLLNQVLDESKQLIKYIHKDKLSLITENRLPEDKRILILDGKLIEQVLLQLIDNSIKFTPFGYILFGCEMDEDNKSVSFFVNDTGIGIPVENMNLIFKRFWKPGDLYTQDYRGLGIGLPLSNELVHLMGGTLNVTSTPYAGSTFRFSIPISDITNINDGI